jgi:membrane fusion protein, multidrug efflux system
MRTTIFIIALSLLIYSCGSRAKEINHKRDESIPVKLISIQEEAADNTISLSGYLSTEGAAKLSFKTGGVIDKIFVDESDRIRRGQLLATLKSTEISAQVQQVQLSVEKATRDYQRANNLYKDSVATLEQLQNAKTGLDIAKQNYQQAIFNQQYSKIYATEDGFIVRKMKNEGELAEPGGPVLMTGAVSNSSKWILSSGVSDKEWSMLQNGNKAIVTIEAFPGKTFPAILSKKALAANSVDGSFGVELQVDFGKEQPAIGMFGKAIIKTNDHSTGWVIPYESLLEASGKKGFVFGSNDGKTVQKVEVTISSIDENTLHISQGLEGYKYVISSGSPYLNNQSTIRVIK